MRWRFLFLRDLYEDEQGIARCSRADERDVRRRVAALGERQGPRSCLVIRVRGATYDVFSYCSRED